MSNNILLEFKKHVQLEKVNKNYTIGTVTLLIYSKETFKNNKDIISFLSDVFNESYLPYVIKSRTLVAAKLGRALANKEEESFKKIDKSILAYFDSTILDDSKKAKKIKKTKKKNANDKLDSWLRGF
ncbi:hypothetical protein [Bacillus pseudomycoides]|uniref:hypothetical protein n=1 Tax=Bacillus pseudomycoides TaxID=64104 RepID=UPI000BF92D1A|nr:hypothetical protein [Bacillus pseudomycoides]MED1536197.1 hypothetical protein [Bacillus pseudomycoides]PFZ87513.1 hypothetical protein COL70_21975 [Bacillus pseudomycoides]PHD16379.1 hypothetical protein COF46_14805 [Bacillus pseudomycoides]